MAQTQHSRQAQSEAVPNTEGFSTHPFDRNGRPIRIGDLVIEREYGIGRVVYIQRDGWIAYDVLLTDRGNPTSGMSSQEGRCLAVIESAPQLPAAQSPQLLEPAKSGRPQQSPEALLERMKQIHRELHAITAEIDWFYSTQVEIDWSAFDGSDTLEAVILSFREVHRDLWDIIRSVSRWNESLKPDATE